YPVKRGHNGPRVIAVGQQKAHHIALIADPVTVIEPAFRAIEGHQVIPTDIDSRRQVQQQVGIDIHQACRIFCPLQVTAHPVQPFGYPRQHPLSLRYPRSRYPCCLPPVRNSLPASLGSWPPVSALPWSPRFACPEE